MYITFGTGAEAPVPRAVDNRMPSCRLPTARGTESGEARRFQKKVLILKLSKQFPQACTNSQTGGKCGKRPTGAQGMPGTSEFGNLPGRLIGAIEDGAQGNINIYENIRT